MMKIPIKLPVFFGISLFFLLVNCSDDDKILSGSEETAPEQQENPDQYEPGDANKIEKDPKITPTSASASEHQPNTDIQKSIDGDKSTLYHSRWGGATEYPVALEYNFTAGIDRIDYFVLYPRTDSNNGIILIGTVYIKAQGEDSYTKFKDFEFKDSATPKIITFPKGFKNPAAIKISVTKGVNDFVSLAEIEFYKKSASLAESLSVFSDKACTQLKNGIDREEILKIENEFVRNMALAIYNGVYENFRIGNFRSYPDPNIISGKNKTGTYGIYDNVTGIYVKWGTEMVVFMDDFQGEISLRVVNHNQGFQGIDYALRPGVNRFKVDTEGLAYLIYQDGQQHVVKANFATGKVNGYFDISKHTNEDWKALINNAEYSFFDVLGKYAHLTFTTEDFRQYTQDITELVGLYDEIVQMEEDFMGLYKYNRENKTHMYFRTNTNQDMYMYATSYRTEYSKGTMPNLCDPAKLKSDPWGPAHEVGHINQTRPGLRWLGMTEVTNNIHSLYVQTAWGNGARIDVEDLGRYNNRYEKAFTEILAPGLAHAAHPDVFCKLVPFWQLQLYFANVRGYGDFYKDVYEMIRENENPPTPGANQVEFVKICSDVAQTDLTDFFKAWGFLTPGSFTIDDYGQGTLEVTQTMVNDAMDYINSKGYPKPSEKIACLHEQSLNIFKNKASVTAGNATVSGNNITISGTSNAVVFQQERNGKVIYISPRNSFSVGSFNTGDKLFAVGYDGGKEEIQVQ